MLSNQLRVAHLCGYVLMLLAQLIKLIKKKKESADEAHGQSSGLF